jgi:hypothetical protein
MRPSSLAAPSLLLVVAAASAGSLGCGKKTEAPTASSAAAPVGSAPSAHAVGSAHPMGSVNPMARMGQAIQAAASAAAQGGTSCERAHNGIVAMVAELGKSGGHADKAPDRAKFLEACGELPAPMQQCLDVSYALQHAKDCQEQQKKLTPEQIAKLKAMMGG